MTELEQYQFNLQRLREQAAMYGSDVPLKLVNDIAYHEQKIQELSGDRSFATDGDVKIKRRSGCSVRIVLELSISLLMFAAPYLLLLRQLSPAPDLAYLISILLSCVIAVLIALRVSWLIYVATGKRIKLFVLIVLIAVAIIAVIGIYIGDVLAVSILSITIAYPVVLLYSVIAKHI
jgi:hypothetical protein